MHISGGLDIGYQYEPVAITCRATQGGLRPRALGGHRVHDLHDLGAARELCPDRAFWRAIGLHTI